MDKMRAGAFLFHIAAINESKYALNSSGKFRKIVNLLSPFGVSCGRLKIRPEGGSLTFY